MTEIEGFLYFFSFFLGLIGIVYLYGIIGRTNQALRSSYNFILLGLICLVLYLGLNIISIFQIQNFPFFLGLLSILYIVFLFVGISKIRFLIKNMSDYGQSLLLIDKNKHDKKINQIVKNANKTCYVLFKEQSKEVFNQILKNTNPDKIFLINTTNVKYDNIQNLTNIDNNPAAIKNTLDRILKENQIDTVILDDFIDVQNVQDFELALFVQNISDIIKTSEARGYFIADENKIESNLVKDISLVVDQIEK